MKKALKKHTLLVGEGIHQHTLYGSFAMELEVPTEFPQVLVKEDSQLKHEKPNGSWSNEHKTLIVRPARRLTCPHRAPSIACFSAPPARRSCEGVPTRQVAAATSYPSPPPAAPA